MLPYFYYDLATVDRHVLPNVVQVSLVLVELRILPSGMRVYGLETVYPIMYSIANDGRVVVADCGHLDQFRNVQSLEAGKSNLLGGRPG